MKTTDMDKNIIQKIILENQELVEQIELVERHFFFEPHGNYVLVGVRQAGKSYLLYQRMKQLIAKGHQMEELVYINFDDERIANIKTEEMDLIIQAHQALSSTQPILFLDEIQNITGWEHFARRLANQKYQVYITGSNAKMLSRDIATTLGGRYWVVNVYPYSFDEFLEAHAVQLKKNWEFSKQSAEVQRLFQEYFYYGGFPELTSVIDKRGWITGIFQKIFFSDVIARNGVRNEEALRMTIRKLADSVKQPMAYNRISNLVCSTGVKTNAQSVINYVGFLKDSCLIFSLENYASKFVEKETMKKHYFIDNGLLNLFLVDPETSLLENLCAIHLYKKYGNEVYYYNKGIEVDFYVPEENLAIQVSYSITDETTRSREISALVKFANAQHIEKALIVTRDSEQEIEESHLKIAVVPIWKWLLS